MKNTIYLASCALCLLAARAALGGEILFDDVTESAGVLAPTAGMMGHGAAWGDVDNDGRPDLLVGGFCDRPDAEYAPSAGPVPNRLLINRGHGRFESRSSGDIARYGRTSGAVFADLNNDGWLDLYIANNAKPAAARADTPEIQAQARRQLSLLFRNDHGMLNDISAQSGAVPETLHTARNIAVIDVDGDSLLDLLVVEDRFRKEPRSKLFRNLGDFRFQDVTVERGLSNDLFGLGHAVADLNDDGRPDLFIGHSNRCFLSTPEGQFVEPQALHEQLAWNPLNDEDWPCGAAFGDLDRDGDFDLVVGIHCSTARNRVYLNEGLKDGVPQYRDVTDQVGLAASIPVRCPHVEIQDFDNDGWPDLYFSAGWRNANGSVTPLIFRHQGMRDGLPTFVPPREIAEPMVYYPAGPSADFDGDGRLDLFLVNWFSGDHCHLLQNTSKQQNWLDVSVQGTTFNRMGLGTQIRIYSPGHAGDPQALLGFQELQIGCGYASGQLPICHFGLGTTTTVDLVARLPNCQRVVRRDVASNQRLILVE